MKYTLRPSEEVRKNEKGYAAKHSAWLDALSKLDVWIYSHGKAGGWTDQNKATSAAVRAGKALGFRVLVVEEWRA